MSMDNASIKKSRFSLKNKIAPKLNSSLECVDSTENLRPILEDVNVATKESINKSNYLPLLNVYNLIKWQPLPDITELLNDKEDCPKENNILKQEMFASVWVPLPKSCLKCIAHQFVKLKLDLHEDGSQIQNIESRDLQIRKRKSMPDCHTNKRARIESGSNHQIQNNCALERCPVCGFEFSTNSQEERDAHVARCLSGADVDIMW